MYANQFEPFLAPAYISGFIALWICVCQLISLSGGWKILSRDYRANSAFEGKKVWLKSARLRRWTNYNNCLVVGSNKYGLYLAVLPIFRVGHPPLFIPWMDISTEAGSKRLWGDFVKFKFAKQPDVPVVFPKKVAAKIFQLRRDSQTGIGP